MSRPAASNLHEPPLVIDEYTYNASGQRYVALAAKSVVRDWRETICIVPDDATGHAVLSRYRPLVASLLSFLCYGGTIAEIEQSLVELKRLGTVALGDLEHVATVVQARRSHIFHRLSDDACLLVEEGQATTVLTVAEAQAYCTDPPPPDFPAVDGNPTADDDEDEFAFLKRLEVDAEGNLKTRRDEGLQSL